MRKLSIIAIIFILLMPVMVFADGSCVQTPYAYSISGPVVIKFVCTGDAGNGSIPTQTVNAANMALVQWTHYFYQAIAYPTSGGTAPDAADVAVLMGGQDLLGTKGVNLIHATATQDTSPYSAFMTSYRYPMVTSAITMTVANQATISANYTIELVFAR